MPSKNLQEAKHVATPITDEGIIINGPGFGKIQFDNGAITYYRKSKRWIKFQSYLKGTLFTPTAKAIDANTITYQGGNFVQVKYEFYGDDYKEYITLKDLPQAQRIKLSDISFLITTSEGTHVSQQTNGDLWLMRTASGGITERRLMIIPAPTAIDANQVVYPIAWSYNETTHYLTITGSLTGATYPVIIDPSVDLDAAADTNCTAGTGQHVTRDDAGRIWVVWIDDADVEVGYSDDNGASFTGEEPVTLGSKDLVFDTSICVDGNRDVHLTYHWYDDSVGGYPNAGYLRDYLKRTHSSSTWGSAANLASGSFNDSAAHGCIAVNSSNYPIVFINGQSNSAAAWVTWWTGSAWDWDVTGSKGTKGNCAIDTNGYKHIIVQSYEDSVTTLKYKRHTAKDTFDNIETISTNSSAIGSIAVDLDDNIHVAYIVSNGLYYKKKTGATWGNEETIVSSGVNAEQFTITLDQAGNPIVAYTDSTNSYFTIRRKTGAGWGSAEVLFSAHCDYVGAMFARYPSCPTDNISNIPIEGILGVVFDTAASDCTFIQTNDYQPANICETVYSCQLGSGVSNYLYLHDNTGKKICRDSSGRIWVAWVDTNSYGAYVRYSDDGGRSWSASETVAYGIFGHYSISIAVDGNRDLHTCYTSTSGYLYHKKRTHSDSTWGSETAISAYMSDMGAIAVDSSNYPHIVFRSAADTISHKWQTSGGWQTAEIVEQGTTAGTSPAIAIDTSDNIHCIYVRDWSDIKYRKKTGASWDSAETVASGISNGAKCTIALDSVGNVYTAFYDSAGYIKVYQRTSSWGVFDSWTNISSSNAFDISVDQSDYVYVAYIDSYTIPYVKKHTTSWQAAVQLTANGIQIAGISLLYADSSDKSGVPLTGAMAVFLKDTISTSYRGEYVWKSSDLKWGKTSLITKSLAYSILNILQKSLRYNIKGPSTWDVERADGNGQFSVIDNISFISAAYQDDDTFTAGVTYHYRIREKFQLDQVTTYGPYSNEYDVTYSGGGTQTIQKSLKYTIPTTPTPITKTLVYKISRTVTPITKNVAYKINRSIGITKDLKYAIGRTIISLTKSLKYTILVTKPVTKNLTYYISVTKSTITKNLKYTIGKTITPITKSLLYTIKSTHTAITKNLAYYISKTIPATTKSLKYNIKLNISPITKSVLYVIYSTKPITKELTYAIGVTQTKQITKDLKYAISKTVTAITKNLVYYIVKSKSITKNLQYDIQATKLTTKSVVYYISRSLSTTKSLKYSIATTSKITKSLVYSILNVKTKSLVYTIVRTPSALTKSVRYFITTTKPITKTTIYYVVHSLPVTKSLKYTITRSIQTTKQLLYDISTTKQIQKNVSYSIQKTLSVTKQLVYDITSSIGIQKSVQYAIIPSAPILTQVGSCIRIDWVVT